MVDSTLRERAKLAPNKDILICMLFLSIILIGSLIWLLRGFLPLGLLARIWTEGVFIACLLDVDVFWGGEVTGQDKLGLCYYSVQSHLPRLGIAEKSFSLQEQSIAMLLTGLDLTVRNNGAYLPGLDGGRNDKAYIKGFTTIFRFMKQTAVAIRHIPHKPKM